jgi:hypothetical protein
MQTVVELGSTIRNIVAAPHTVTGLLQTGLVVRREEIPWQTGRPVPANKSASRAAAISAIGRLRERARARGLPLAVPTAEEAGTPQALAAARMPSEEDPEDSTDPALVQLVAVVPPAWDREVVAPVVAADGGDKRQITRANYEDNI